jgi:hypothetical protein
MKNLDYLPHDPHSKRIQHDGLNLEKESYLSLKKKKIMNSTTLRILPPCISIV